MIDKVYVVTAVDYGDSCDGKARVLGTFKSETEAKNFVIEDIKTYIDDNTADSGECPFIADFDKMSVIGSISTDFGCEWNIESVTIQ